MISKLIISIVIFSIFGGYLGTLEFTPSMIELWVLFGLMAAMQFNGLRSNK